MSARDTKVDALRLAIKRIETGRVKTVPPGTRLSISSVAAEAGLAPSTIHTRYPDIAESIREKTGRSAKAQRLKQKETDLTTKGLLNSKNREIAELRRLLESVTSRLASTTIELQQFKDEQQSASGRVVPIGSRS